MKNQTPTEIHDLIYGPDGLYKRVVDEIDDIGIRKAGKLCNKSTQHMNMIRAAFVKNEIKSKPKLETIMKIAKSLGVE